MQPIQTLRLAAVSLLLTSLPAAFQVVRDSPTERLRQRKAEVNKSSQAT